MQSMVDIEKEKENIVQTVTTVAMEMGVSAKTPTLFEGLHKIIQNKNEMKFFLALGPEERMLLLQMAAEVHN